MDEKSALLNKPTHPSKKGPCPDCGVGMFVFRAGNTLIDKCNECHGLWLDHREFPVFKKTLDQFNLKKIRRIYFPPEPEGSHHVRDCPNCPNVLGKVKYSYNSGVHFFKCDDCLGLWSPLQQTLKLISHTKIGQEVSKDVAGFLGELGKLEEDRKFYHKLAHSGRMLSYRIRRYFFRF